MYASYSILYVIGYKKYYRIKKNACNLSSQALYYSQEVRKKQKYKNLLESVNVMKDLWKEIGNNIHVLAGYTIFLACGSWHIQRPYGHCYSRSFMTLANAKRFVEKRLGY